MNKRRGIIPNDISSSREYFGLNNSQDIYKGTSFKFSGPWTANTHYFNDEYIVDFVTYEGCLWACSRNHLSAAGNEPGDKSRYWDLALEGVPGVQGPAPIIGVVEVDNKKYISYRYNEDEDWVNIIDVDSLKGEKGDSRIWVGPEPPAEGSTYEVWINTSDSEGSVIKVGSSGFDVRQVEKLPDLSTMASEDIAKMVGHIYMVPSGDNTGDNDFSEYTIVRTATTEGGIEYQWEQISSGGAGVDLNNYYTKGEVEQYVTEKLVEDGYDGGQIEVDW
jgi:hypothetical protein